MAAVMHDTARHQMSCASRQSLGLGITLVVSGILAFVFNGVAIASADALAPVAHGFWGGAMVSALTEYTY